MQGEQTILVVLGVTGDLMARKLGPAMLRLYSQNRSPEKLKIVGFSRREWTDDTLRDHIKTALTKYGDKVKPGQLEEFLQLLTYQQGNFDDADSYKGLADHLKTLEQEWGAKSNRLFYLAVPPDLYGNIFNHLSSSGLMDQSRDRWARLIVEKPFGNDLKHAMELDDLLHKLFGEDQVYRIDHYLAKEAVQNILSFRFANNFLSAAWDKKYIERIDIKLWETLDVEGRGEFYDATGALLDVGQNHLLQLLALVTMDRPPELTPEAIRHYRAAMLDQLMPVDAKHDTVRAQYTGYLKEDEVSPNSTTETYFKVRTFLELPAWRGVPIYLEGGKKLPSVDKQVAVTFRHPMPCLCPPNVHYKNQLFIQIQPEPSIRIRFWSKKPGVKGTLEEQWLDFSHPMGESARYKEEYAQLILDAMQGDLTLFVSGEEAVASWRFIDPIIKAWRKSSEKLPTYNDEKSIIQIAETLDRPSQPLKKEIGLVGLGKMGHNMALRLQEHGWKVTALTRHTEAEDVTVVHDVKKFIRQLKAPRLVWTMVPHNSVDDVLFGKEGIINLLEPGDTIVEGGNSYFVDTKRRAQEVTKHGARFVDVGVSGGPRGARLGAALMIGGKREDFEMLEELFIDFAAAGGYQFFEGYGAGHFVKMVHNGIEYGMMQALAEGVTILKESDYKLDLSRVAEIYNTGSVIESRLVAWLYGALRVHGPELTDVTGMVAHTGEGAWTVDTAKAMKLKAKVIEESLEFRKASAKSPSYTGQVLSALREQFGGHSIAAPDRHELESPPPS